MDKIKALFTGKNAKWMLAGLGLVVIVAFVVMRRKSGSVDTSEYRYASMPLDSMPESGSGTGDAVSRTEMQSLYGDLTRSFGNAIKDQQEQNTELAQQFANSLALTQDSFSQMFSGLQSNVADVREEVNASLMERAANTRDSFKAYEPPDYDQPVNVKTGQKVSTVEEKTFGVGGVDYNKLSSSQKKQMQEQQNTFKTNPVEREKEIARTKQVIANREAAGMDTSAQKKHLVSLGG